MNAEVVAIICTILSALTTFIGAGMLWVISNMRDDVRSLRVEVMRRIDRVEERLNDMTNPNLAWHHARRTDNNGFPP